MKPFYAAEARKHLAMFCWFYAYTPEQFWKLSQRDFESMRDFMLEKLKSDGYNIEDTMEFS